LRARRAGILHTREREELIVGVYRITAHSGSWRRRNRRRVARARSRGVRVFLEDCSFFLGQTSCGPAAARLARLERRFSRACSGVARSADSFACRGGVVVLTTPWSFEWGQSRRIA